MIFHTVFSLFSEVTYFKTFSVPKYCIYLFYLWVSVMSPGRFVLLCLIILTVLQENEKYVSYTSIYNSFIQYSVILSPRSQTFSSKPSIYPSMLIKCWRYTCITQFLWTASHRIRRWNWWPPASEHNWTGSGAPNWQIHDVRCLQEWLNSTR